MLHLFKKIEVSLCSARTCFSSHLQEFEELVLTDLEELEQQELGFKRDILPWDGLNNNNNKIKGASKGGALENVERQDYEQRENSSGLQLVPPKQKHNKMHSGETN